MESFEGELPRFFDLLSESDKQTYYSLRETLSSHACRNRRGKRIETFSEMLNAVKTFCIQSNEEDWKRCLVCGVCWLQNGIAINTRHLSLLIDKCKSSINGSLQKMGYTTLQNRSESAGALSDQIPILRDNFNELREWTIRQFNSTPQKSNRIDFTTQNAYFQQLLNTLSIPAYPMTPVPAIPQYSINQTIPTYSIPMVQTPLALTPMPQLAYTPYAVATPMMVNTQFAPKITKTRKSRKQRILKQKTEPPAEAPEIFNQSQHKDEIKIDQESNQIDQFDLDAGVSLGDYNPLALTPAFFFDDSVGNDSVYQNFN